MHQQDTESQPGDLPFQKKLRVLESIAGHNGAGTEDHHQPH